MSLKLLKDRSEPAKNDAGGIPLKSLIIGGASSGKSAYAESLAAASGLAVYYVATATAGDEEMARRIARHRERRPADWGLVEEPLHLAETLWALASPDACLLVDCLTLWLSNLLCADQPGLLAREQAHLLETLPDLPGRIIFVSNELGMGIVPMGELSRQFGEAAGQLNQDLAVLCDRVTLIVAGLPLPLKVS